MHFEFLIEDKSGEKFLEILLPKIIIEPHSFRVRSYKGVGHIPKNLAKKENPHTSTLLTKLPRLIAGYGQAYQNSKEIALVVICDLDDKCLKDFRKQLLDMLDQIKQKPFHTVFCIAIEEGEAWYLGDLEAIRKAYPRAKNSVLSNYVNDSICGTWEKLADAIYKGGAKALSQQGWVGVGKEKSLWATNITPHMNIDENKSPSFKYFYGKLAEILED